MNPLNSRFWFAIGTAAVACLLIAGSVAQGQTPPPDRDTILSGFLSCSRDKDGNMMCPARIHYLNMSEGKTYAIRIETTEFDAKLAIEDLHGNVLASDGDCIEEDLFGCIWFRPPSNDEYRFVVSASMPLLEGFYSVFVRELPIVMRVETTLTTEDEMRDECYQQTHEVTLNEGERYVIELASREFATCLKLLSPDGMIVAFDDEGTTSRPAQIIYTAPRTGVYRLVAASTMPHSVGAFRLTVNGE